MFSTEYHRKLEIHISENNFLFLSIQLRVTCSIFDPLSEVNIFFRSCNLLLKKNVRFSPIPLFYR